MISRFFDRTKPGFSSRDISPASWLMSVLIISIYLTFCLYEIGRPPIDLHQYRQTQTLATIYNFYINGINLLRPELNTNGSHSVVILEFPLYQAIVALLMKAFTYSEIIARLVSIFSVLVGGVYLARFSHEYLLPRSFNPVLATFLINPSIIFWGSVPLADPLAFSLSVVASYYLYKGYKEGSAVSYFAALVLGGCAVGMKPTSAFIPFATILSIILLRRRKNTELIIPALLSMCFVIVLISWLSYSKLMQQVNPHLYTEIGASWYFGTVEQRLNIGIYYEFIKRILVNHAGWLTIPGMAMIAYRGRWGAKDNALLITLLALFFTCAYLIFFINLNYVHTYYQIPLTYLNSLAGGLGITIALTRLAKVKWLRAHALLGSILALTILGGSTKYVLFNSWVDVSVSKSPYNVQTCEYEIGKQIKETLEEYAIDSKLIGITLAITDRCWSGDHALMYYLKKRGYVVGHIDDEELGREKLDLIISIFRDGQLPEKQGWTTVYRNRVKGAARAYEYAVLLPVAKNSPSKQTIEIISGSNEVVGEAKIKGSHVIAGDKNIRFNTGLTVVNLPINTYSRICVNFSARSASPTETEGYFIMRSYEGGFGRDQTRQLKFDHEKIHNFSFLLESSRFEDYVFEFGAIFSGSYEIVGPITVTSDPVFTSSKDAKDQCFE